MKVYTSKLGIALQGVEHILVSMSWAAEVMMEPDNETVC